MERLVPQAPRGDPSHVVDTCCFLGLKGVVAYQALRGLLGSYECRGFLLLQ